MQSPITNGCIVIEPHMSLVSYFCSGSRVCVCVCVCVCAGAYLEVDTNQDTWWALGPTISRVVWGHAPPENFEFYGCSEVLSGAFCSWNY